MFKITEIKKTNRVPTQPAAEIIENRYLLENGMSICTFQDKNANKTFIHLTIRGVGINTNVKKRGIAELTLFIIFKVLENDSLLKNVVRDGGSCYAQIHLDSVTLKFETLIENVENIFSHLQKTLTTLTISSDEITKYRDLFKNQYQGKQRELEFSLNKYYLTEGNVFENSVEFGSNISEDITEADVKDFFARSYCANRMTLIIYSDLEITKDQLELFSELPNTSVKLKAVDQIKNISKLLQYDESKKKRLIVVNRPMASTNAVIFNWILTIPTHLLKAMHRALVLILTKQDSGLFADIFYKNNLIKLIEVYFPQIYKTDSQLCVILTVRFGGYMQTVADIASIQQELERHLRFISGYSDLIYDEIRYVERYESESRPLLWSKVNEINIAEILSLLPHTEDELARFPDQFYPEDETEKTQLRDFFKTFSVQDAIVSFQPSEKVFNEQFAESPREHDMHRDLTYITVPRPEIGACQPIPLALKRNPYCRFQLPIIDCRSGQPTKVIDKNDIELYEEDSAKLYFIPDLQFSSKKAYLKIKMPFLLSAEKEEEVESFPKIAWNIPKHPYNLSLMQIYALLIMAACNTIQVCSNVTMQYTNALEITFTGHPEALGEVIEKILQDLVDFEFPDKNFPEIKQQFRRAVDVMAKKDATLNANRLVQDIERVFFQNRDISFTKLKEEIENFTLNDFKFFHFNCITKDNLLVLIGGNLTFDHAKAIFQKNILPRFDTNRALLDPTKTQTKTNYKFGYRPSYIYKVIDTTKTNIVRVIIDAPLEPIDIGNSIVDTLSFIEHLTPSTRVYLAISVLVRIITTVLRELLNSVFKSFTSAINVTGNVENYVSITLESNTLTPEELSQKLRDFFLYTHYFLTRDKQTEIEEKYKSEKATFANLDNRIQAICIAQKKNIELSLDDTHFELVFERVWHQITSPIDPTLSEYQAAVIKHFDIKRLRHILAGLLQDPTKVFTQVGKQPGFTKPISDRNTRHLMEDELRKIVFEKSAHNIPKVENEKKFEGEVAIWDKKVLQTNKFWNDILRLVNKSYLTELSSSQTRLLQFLSAESNVANHRAKEVVFLEAQTQLHTADLEFLINVYAEFLAKSAKPDLILKITEGAANHLATSYLKMQSSYSKTSTPSMWKASDDNVNEVSNLFQVAILQFFTFSNTSLTIDTLLSLKNDLLTKLSNYSSLNSFADIKQLMPDFKTWEISFHLKKALAMQNNITFRV